MFADSDRGSILNILLSEVDLTNPPKWDDAQLSNLRSEIRDHFRKPNGITKLCFAFETSFKLDFPGVLVQPEEILLTFLRWGGFSKGESVALSFALSYSSSSALASAGRRALRVKLPEITTAVSLAEIPDEARTSLIHFVQSDEEFSNVEISGSFLALCKEHFALSSGLAPSMAGMAKPSLSSADLGSLGKLSELGRQRISVLSVLEEYGNQCSVTADSFRKVLASTGQRIDEEQLVAIMLLVLPKSYNSEAPQWNLEVVADVLCQECRGLNWTLVAKFLDNPRLSIRTEGDYLLLSRLFVRISGGPIPAAGLLANLWSNKPAQFAVLMLSAGAPRGIVDFSPLVPQEQLLTGDSGIAVPPNYSWLCLPLYVRLLDLASSGLALEVLEVITKAANIYPEYVLTCLAQVQDHSGVRLEVIQKLLPHFTSLPGSKSSSLVVMKRLCAVNLDVLLRLCCVAFRSAKKYRDALQVENIVKSLGPQFMRKLEEDGSLEELLPLWCVRAERNEVSFEEKLGVMGEQIMKNYKAYCALFRQVLENMRSRYSQHNDGLLTFDTGVALIRALQPLLQESDWKSLVAIYQQQQSLQQQQLHAAQLMQQQQQGSTLPLSASRDPVREIVEAPEVTRLPPGQESEDVEVIANAYFQKIYTTDIAIPEVIALLRQFKSSAEKKEQEIFRCMVHNLFDEYRFFHKYPEKELQITGRLFGALIQHQLVSSITLGIALRYVLEALRKDPEQGEGNEKMFRFGQIALDQFRSRLGEWPQYCSHLIQIPHLSRHNADLFQEAQRALTNPSSQPSPSMQQQPSNPPAALHAAGPPAAPTPSQFPAPTYDFGSANPASYSTFPPQMAPPSFPPFAQPSLNSAASQGNLSAMTSNVGSQVFAGMPSFSGTPPEGPNTIVGGGAPSLSKSLLNVAAPSPGPVFATGAPNVTAGLAASMPPLPEAAVVTTSSTAPGKEVAVVDRDEQQQSPLHREIDRMVLVNKPVIEPPAPPDAIRDQVQFIINNMAKTNIEAKTTELKDLLKPECFAWFAAYLVEKRVSSQPNLHNLYLTMLDSFQFSDLNKHILDSTYYNVTKYLSSPIITTSSNERSVLRNFGMWLGQLTLARNRPLLQRRINLKELIFWGYETGRLIAVCSFIAKVIEGAKESKVFRPPNPWLMAILGVLKELNEIEDLKLNIKFEVQALCKNINVKLDEIPKTNLLSKCRPPIKDQRNPDFNVKSTASQGTPAPTPVQPSPLQGGIPATIQQPVASAGAGAGALPAPGAFPGEAAAAAGGLSGGSGVSGSVGNLPIDIAASVVVSPALQYFTSNPTQRRLVIVAVERGIREIIGAAVDRAVSIATATTKQLITKDFANEGNEVIMRNAAHLMASSLASSLALAICKEPLRISIINHLRTLLSPVVTDQAVIEQIVQVCSTDNIDVGSSLIEKASIEKAVKDIDELLAPAFQNRKKAREAGQPFVDTSAAQLPAKLSSELLDMLRMSPAGLTPAQLQLYEAFQRVKPSAALAQSQAAGAGAAPLLSAATPAFGAAGADAKAVASTPVPGPVLSMAQALEAYQSLYARIDNSLKALQAQMQGREVTLSMLGSDHEIVGALRDLIVITQRIQPAVRNETAMTFSETLFHKMFDSISNPDPLRLEVSVSILEAVREACGGSKVFNPDVMSWLGKYALLVNNDDMSRKVYRHILLLLLRAKLVRAQEIDRYLAIHMDGGRHLFWLEVALSFIKQCFVENLCSVYDFTNTLDTITKMRPSSMIMKKQLQKWITDIRALATAQEEQRMAAGGASAGAAAAAAAAATGMGAISAANAAGVGAGAIGSAALGGAGVAAAAAVPALSRVDPALKEQVTILLDRWLRVWNNVTDQVFTHYLQLMHQVGVLKTEDAADRFFRVATDICVDACVKSATASEAANSLNYTVIDALARLFLLLIRFADKETSDINVRVNLLNRILGAVLRSFQDEMELRRSTSQPFDQRPYYRLFSNLSQDLGIPDPKSETNAALLPLLSAYTHVYLVVQPSAAPAFAFSWLQLISKRWFMPHLLRTQKCWPAMHRLLSALFIFLQPFLKAGQLPEAVKKLYKGTLRVLLILLHDFPEFLCDFHLSFCDLIPLNCIQLRNLVLSAFPRTMRLPDPFTPNLKVDIMSEISHSPRILTDYAAPLAAFRTHLDSFMSHQQPADIPVKLAAFLAPSGNSGYNVSLLTSVVVYVGAVWIAQLQSKAVPSNPPPAMDIFKALMRGLDAEGRYIIINAMANQLRYPNSHTSLFSNVLLTLFADAEDEFMQEQITRVLLERLVVHRPHPWGLLITFIELIKNPRYAFWKKSFTRGDPEVEKVFENIARSCIGPSAATVIQQQLAGQQA